MTKGYKVFNPDWTCRGFKYEIGQVYTMDEDPICCERGFHFCEKVVDCFQYYKFDPDNKVAEIEALGEIHTNGTKSCTNKIKIIREISWYEVLDLVNTGKECTGFCNSGNRNSGDWNSGDCNSGNRNSGDWNSGDWNKTSFSNGCFNTKEPKIYFFDKPSNWTYRDWMNSRARYLLNKIPGDVIEWIYSENMTDKEKEAYPEHKTTGGYLKILNNSERGQIWWDGLIEEDQKCILSLPNFDKEIFKEITGIDVESGDVEC